MKKNKERINPLKIKKRMYGSMAREEAFTKALDPYFKKDKKLNVS